MEAAELNGSTIYCFLLSYESSITFLFQERKLPLHVHIIPMNFGKLSWFKELDLHHVPLLITRVETSITWHHLRRKNSISNHPLQISFSYRLLAGHPARLRHTSQVNFMGDLLDLPFLK